MLTLRVDYVFVDEHNRHKRLKGKLLGLVWLKTLARTRVG